jgi:ureidoglycolate lyase
MDANDELDLIAHPLDAAAFAPFGSVLEAAGAGDAVNGGSASRHEAVPALDLVREGGRAVMAIYRAQARPFPFDALELERHTLSDQVFVPLGAPLRCVVLVAPAGPAPVASDCIAFLSNGLQGVRIAAGVWHHGLLSLDPGAWAVLERRGASVDCDVARLARPLRVRLPRLRR